MARAGIGGFTKGGVLPVSRHARDVVLHMSHDAWVEEEKQDIPMAPLSDSEVSVCRKNHRCRECSSRLRSDGKNRSVISCKHHWLRHTLSQHPVCSMAF